MKIQNIKYYFQFDTNVFQKLSRSISFYNSFVNILKKKNLSPSKCQAGYYLTPFTIMEAIGIIPNTIDIEHNETEHFDDFLSKSITLLENNYKTAPELQKEHFLEAIEKNKPIDVTNEQKKIYDLCITRVVNDSEFIPELIKHLIYDFLFKFRFNRKNIKELFNLFKREIFSDDRERFSISKFRLIQNYWNSKRTLIEKNIKGTEAAIRNTFKGLSLKSHRDYLDCDIIHSTCMGYLRDHGQIYPIAAFTFDSKTTILPRISLYKGYIRHVKEQFPQIHPNYKNGLICFVNSKGNDMEIIDISDIQCTG